MTAAIRITLITAIFTVLLAILKLIFGHYGQSHALFADGFHSLSDVLIDVFVLLAAYYGAKQADSNHPYGHGRIETAATFGLALILILVGIGIMWNAGEHIWGGKPAPVPDVYVLWVALIAIIINEIIFRVTLKIAKNIKSSLLEANAWHSRSDVAVSIIVLLGIGGALLGFPYLDIVGAVLVGIMICKLGAGLAWQSISELVDTGADEEILEKIKNTIINIPGVCMLHMLRTRMINNRIFVDVHILVSPYISVSEGHFIGDQVIVALKKHSDISDITVHVDPEDDEAAHPSSNLPTRDKIMGLLEDLPKPKDIRLHYLNGKIEIEILITDLNLAASYKKALEKIDYIRKVDVVLLLDEKKEN